MNKLKTLSGAQLKYIAFTTMLIDHVNKALIYPNLNGGILLVISDIFDILGRIAFPIFIFLLIEGYFRTTNRWKYLGMLLLFGIISEIPYDMFTTASYFEPNGNNIMFTLALVHRYIKRKNGSTLAYIMIFHFRCNRGSRMPECDDIGIGL